MGINRYWCRGVGGPLHLLLSFVVVSGCGQVAPEPKLEADPNGSPNVTSPSAPTLAPTAPNAVTPAALIERFAADAPQQPLCGDRLLGTDFGLDDSGLPTLYVDGATDTLAPDGSAAAPFRTLAAALLLSNSAPSDSAPTLAPQRRVLVAGGYYDEDVAVPVGTLLLGGYNPQSWELGEIPSVISGSVYVGTETPKAGIISPEGYLIHEDLVDPPPSTAPLSAVQHFTLSGGVEVVPGARALLRDNLIAPLFYGTKGDPPGLRRAMSVWVNAATVRADRNHLVVTVEDPASVVSAGFFTWDSCAWITENEITDYRSPIYFHEGRGAAATFNVIQRGENGVGAGTNQPLIAANYIHTRMPLSGCVYAISLHTNAHPDIRDNTIYLTNEGNRGIVETDAASHPTALLGNRFYSPQSNPVLYVDTQGAANAALLTTTVGALNAVPDIPTIGGNTLTRVSP